LLFAIHSLGQGDEVLHVSQAAAVVAPQLRRIQGKRDMKFSWYLMPLLRLLPEDATRKTVQKNVECLSGFEIMRQQLTAKSNTVGVTSASCARSSVTASSFFL
jgi:hypothetical protein